MTQPFAAGGNGRQRQRKQPQSPTYRDPKPAGQRRKKDN